MADTNILNPSECAKDLRKIFKEKFTETFNVSTNTIDGFARIRVEWENGASYDEIKNITNPYIYKENDESDNGIVYKCKYIMLNRMFTSPIIESLTDILINGQELNDTDRENFKSNAKSILLKHNVPSGSTKILNYDSVNDTITFNNNIVENIKQVQFATDVEVSNEKKSEKKAYESRPLVSEEGKSLITEVDGIKVIKYSEKSFILIGDNTKNYKEKLKELQGRFNPSLSFEGEKYKGWVFSLKKMNEVKALLNF